MTLLLSDIKSEACILYIDPLRPHLSSADIVFQKELEIERYNIYSHLLLWLNFELKKTIFAPSIYNKDVPIVIQVW